MPFTLGGTVSHRGDDAGACGDADLLPLLSIRSFTSIRSSSVSTTPSRPYSLSTRVCASCWQPATTNTGTKERPRSSWGNREDDGSSTALAASSSSQLTFP
ncbi:hypothetical protein EYF80_008468 [Liparis tanakae]|uniref:Uncharacterized protein n=1 Tax=Liparis tanakae TaxID=230148 RepID=A0A4Z2IVX1_9TELE|nr:hypothetical protein EYF80_008468 [Liparis tanakae]